MVISRFYTKYVFGLVLLVGVGYLLRTTVLSKGTLKTILASYDKNPGTPRRPSFVVNRDPSFDYLSAMETLNKNRVAMDDPILIDLIRNYYMEPPSDLPYNLTYPGRIDQSKGQMPYIDQRLHNKEHGFFVECGALDGERGSNTLFFERYRHWSGLLIEASPSNYEKLKTKHRKSYSINACLSTVPYPAKMKFKSNFNLGRLVQDNTTKSQANVHDLQCFPLYSLLLAINQINVDFFSLDVEGDELKVLETVPFDKVDIDFMAVEYIHQSGSKGSMVSFAQKHGYLHPLSITRSDDRANDVILRKKRPSCTNGLCPFKFFPS